MTNDPPEDLVSALGPGAPPKEESPGDRRRRDTSAKVATTVSSRGAGRQEQQMTVEIPTTIQFAIVRPDKATEIVIITIGPTENSVRRVEVVRD